MYGAIKLSRESGNLPKFRLTAEYLLGSSVQSRQAKKQRECASASSRYDGCMTMRKGLLQFADEEQRIYRRTRYNVSFFAGLGPLFKQEKYPVTGICTCDWTVDAAVSFRRGG